jgi:hypothetical protein
VSVETQLGAGNVLEVEGNDDTVTSVNVSAMSFARSTISSSDSFSISSCGFFVFSARLAEVLLFVVSVSSMRLLLLPLVAAWHCNRLQKKTNKKKI